MENNEETKKDMESTAESVEDVVETSKVEENKEKTFTRDEVNKMINAEKQKERQAILEEMKAKKAEADKLAQMDENQKTVYKLETETARADKAEAKLSAYMLKDETIKQATERGISLGYIELLDFSNETAESIKNKLDVLEKTTKADREKIINEYSKEDAPQTGKRDHSKTKEELKSYNDWVEYYKNNPKG